MSRPPDQSRAHSAIKGLGVIVMAAGLGKRMRSKMAKVLHPVAGRPMVLYIVDMAKRLAGEGVAVVVGHQGKEVRHVIQGTTSAGSANRLAMSVAVVEQPQQLGTGHAVLQARAAFSSKQARVSHYLILNGDTPLLSEATVRQLLAVHREQGATVTILTAVLDDAGGYGRVIRRQVMGCQEDGPHNRVTRIVEDRDASDTERQVREVNVGTYVVDGRFLFEALDKLEPKNAQEEYYLTDIVQAAADQGEIVAAVRLSHADEGLGINTRAQLAAAEQVIRQRIRTRWLDEGVTMIDPSSTWIDSEVTIGRDTVLYPNVILEGRTLIGEDCVVRSQTRVTDAVIGARVELLDHCVLRDCRVEDDVVVGPFAHLRPGTVVHRKAKVGNFVEIKKADIGEGSKANHLSYLGDAVVGKGVNIGAGTITCNYDGRQKHRTVIEDDVFIGSDSQLVAPVTLGRGSLVAAGTTVTEDVPADALVLSRVPQVTRAGWAARRRALNEDPSQNTPGKQAKRATGDKSAGRGKRR